MSTANICAGSKSVEGRATSAVPMEQASNVIIRETDLERMTRGLDVECSGDSEHR